MKLEKEFDKEYKERMKLDRADILELFIITIVIALSITAAIANNNMTWILVGLAWINVFIERYLNKKLNKMHEWHEEILQDTVCQQFKIINLKDEIICNLTDDEN